VVIEIGKTIKDLREKKELTQEKLAQNAGISYMTLVKIEQGVNDNPTLKTLTAVAKALGVGVDDLISNKLLSK